MKRARSQNLMFRMIELDRRLVDTNVLATGNCDEMRELRRDLERHVRRRVEADEDPEPAGPPGGGSASMGHSSSSNHQPTAYYVRVPMGAHNTDIAGQGHVTDPMHLDSRPHTSVDEAFF